MEVNATISTLLKKAFNKSTLFGVGVEVETKIMVSEGESKGALPMANKLPIYTELDDDDGEFSEASSGGGRGFFTW